MGDRYAIAFMFMTFLLGICIGGRLMEWKYKCIERENDRKERDGIRER